MPAGKSARRLASLAQLAGGGRPFYVRRPISPSLLEAFPAEGWYWTPDAHPVAVWLGASEIDATLALHKIIRDQEEAEQHEPAR